jgi:hypothetical protein
VPHAGSVQACRTQRTQAPEPRHHHPHYALTVTPHPNSQAPLGHHRPYYACQSPASTSPGRPRHQWASHAALNARFFGPTAAGPFNRVTQRTKSPPTHRLQYYTRRVSGLHEPWAIISLALGDHGASHAALNARFFGPTLGSTTTPYYTPTVTRVTSRRPTPLSTRASSGPLSAPPPPPILHPNSHTRLEAGTALAQGRHSTPLPALGSTTITHTTPQQSHAPRSRQGSCTGPSLHAPARRGRPRLNPAAWGGGAGSSRVVTRAVTPRLCAPGPTPPQPIVYSRREPLLQSSRVDTRAATLRAVTRAESLRGPLLCAPLLESSRDAGRYLCAPLLESSRYASRYSARRGRPRLNPAGAAHSHAAARIIAPAHPPTRPSAPSSSATRLAA